MNVEFLTKVRELLLNQIFAIRINIKSPECTILLSILLDWMSLYAACLQHRIDNTFPKRLFRQIRFEMHN